MGLADSQFNLALMYERGLGAGKNLSKAYFWYVVAAQAGDKEAEAKAQRLKQTLPAAEVRRLETEAANWSPSSLEARQVSHRRG
jgi:localization factor PodJL